MKISVESATLLVRNKTGVEYFVQRLLKALVELDSRNKYELVYMAVLGRQKPNLEVGGKNVTERRISWFPGKAYNLLLRSPVGLGIDLLAWTKPDIFFFPNFARWPLLWTRKSVVAVHDLAYLDYPEVIKNTRHRLYLSWTVPRSIRKSTAVAAMSEHTKQRIIYHYGTPADKITVVEPSIDHDVYQPTSAAEVHRVRQKYGISRKYVLYLGTLEPRKNIRRVIQSYLALPEAVQASHQLVLAGGKGWEESDVYRLIEEAGREKVVQTGYVADDDVAALYSGADVFLYPSIYEGWGMQVLEAMACGTPVITADNSSLPEAGGDAAMYVKAEDTPGISAALQKVLTDPELQQKMRAKGLARARMFSWEKSAEKLLKVFNELS
jgi:glycosyltransferase involved in cell wall biosynthesis